MGTEHLFAVVMAGGSGTRFWPLSRRLRPKQLLALTADEEGGDANGVEYLIAHHRGLVDAQYALNEGGGGWPFILSDLKSLLETGEAFDEVVVEVAASHLAIL